MSKATLVIMAAGMGSRYGGGIKQLESVGPNGEIIMDYSIYDAMEAGFDKVVFIIRKDLDKDFRKIIGNRIEHVVEVGYAYQELTDIPQQFLNKAEKRVKPWGTGQAILCCKDIVKEPFLVINADDYYGKEAYREAYNYLMTRKSVSDKMEIGMVGFVLGNTLSENGAVTRGICKISNDLLLEIEETYGIERVGKKAIAEKDGRKIELDLNSPVSMNMWALQPIFFDVLETGFLKFLSDIQPEDVKTEYLLPRIIGDMVEDGIARVRVLSSKDKWFGMTYKEDKELVEEAFQNLIQRGVYPPKIYE